nr:MAG TPA: hypothetical protein [Caudoviricetes sp.]
MVKTLSSIAEYFEIKESEVTARVVAVVSNGDLNAFNGVVIGDITSAGLCVRSKAPGAYRAQCYLIMP